MFAYNTRASQHSRVCQFIDHIKVKFVALDCVHFMRIDGTKPKKVFSKCLGASNQRSRKRHILLCGTDKDSTEEVLGYTRSKKYSELTSD